MKQHNVFKTSTLGGFEKKSVLHYIDELTSKSSGMENSLNDKIREITQANDELTKQVNDFGIKMSSLERQLKDERNKIGILTGEIDKLNLDLLTQKKNEHELDKELQINIEQNKILSSKLDVAEAKANRFDEAAINVGSLMIDAKSAAQKIIEKAMFDVNDIKDTTNKNISSITAEVSNFKNDINNLRGTIDDVVGSIAERLDSLVNSVEQIEKRCQILSSSFGETTISEEPKNITTDKTDNDEDAIQGFTLIDEDSDEDSDETENITTDKTDDDDNATQGFILIDENSDETENITADKTDDNDDTIQGFTLINEDSDEDSDEKSDENLKQQQRFFR
ncbi:MAG: hypothetical protein RSD67_05290 [Oscillospiraceae bacterium]